MTVSASFREISRLISGTKERRHALLGGEVTHVIFARRDCSGDQQRLHNLRFAVPRVSQTTCLAGPPTLRRAMTRTIFILGAIMRPQALALISAS